VDWLFLRLQTAKKSSRGSQSEVTLLVIVIKIKTLFTTVWVPFRVFALLEMTLNYFKVNNDKTVKTRNNVNKVPLPEIIFI